MPDYCVIGFTKRCRCMARTLVGCYVDVFTTFVVPVDEAGDSLHSIL